MLDMKRIGLILVIIIILGGLWVYIDHQENDCISAGICPKGYRFSACDWDGCIVNEGSCRGRGYWDENTQKCFFKN